MSTAERAFRTLPQALAGSFSLSELDGLIAELSVEPDRVGGQGEGIDARARKTVAYFAGLHRLGELVDLARTKRGTRVDIDWQGLLDDYMRPPECPFPGMVPFQAADARFFFGRSGEIDHIVRHFRQHDFLCVIGPSGSGKSSLIHAGALPKIELSAHYAEQFWLVRTARPANDPLRALRAAIGGDLTDPQASIARLLEAASPHQRVLLVIDQFEEIFTLQTDDAGRIARKGFIAAIEALRDAHACAILLAIRADFYPDLINSELWPIDPSQRLDIAPLRGEALRQAIENPAAAVGVALEPGLIEQLLTDASDEPGVLPLVQETMRLLWADMRERMLTLDAYRSLGRADPAARSGLAVAIAAKADATLAGLDEDGQRIARRAYLRLVEFVEGRTQVRRQQTISALRSSDDDPARFDATIERLANNRLLTFTGEEKGAARKVDMAHEAMLRSWPTLRGWVLARREAELARRRLETKAEEWARLGRGSGALLDETELLEAERWLSGPDAAELGYSENLIALITASRKAIDDARREREEAERQKLEVARARAEEQARSARRLRWAAIGLAALVVFAVLAAAAAFTQSGVARRESRVAQARQLASQALIVRDSRVDTGLLASVAAHHVQQDAGVALDDVRSALIAANQCCDDQLIALLRGHTDRVWAVAYNPVITTMLASGGDDGRIVIWDTAALTQTGHISSGRDVSTIYSLAFSPDGRLLASGEAGGVITVRNVADWSEVARMPPLDAGDVISHDGNVHSIAFSPDGTALASGGADGQVVLWEGIADPGGSIRARTLGAHATDAGAPTWVWSVAFSPDGRTVASGGRDRRVRLWSLAPGTPEASVTATLTSTLGLGQVTTVAFTKLGNKQVLMAGDDGGELALWDVTDWQMRPGSLPQIAQDISSGTLWGVSVNPSDGSTLAVGGGSEMIKLWRIAVREPFSMTALTPLSHGLVGHSETLLRIAFSPDGERIAAGGGDSLVSLWHGAEGANVLRHTTAVHSLAYLSDRHKLMTSSAPQNLPMVRALDLNTGQAITHGFDVPAGVTVTLSALSPDGRLLATNANSDRLLVWDVERGELLTELRPRQPYSMHVLSVAFSPDSARLAYGDRNGAIALWRIDQPDDGLLVDSGHSGEVQVLAFSRDGKVLASGGCGSSIGQKSGCGRGEVRLWDAATLGALGDPLPAKSGFVVSLAFSDQLLAAGHVDGAIVVWELPARAMRHELVGNRVRVRALALDPDGAVLAEADNDAVILWDMRSGLPIGQAFREHDASLTALAFGADADALFSASTDNTAIMRDLRTEVLVARACRLANRALTQDEWERFMPGEPPRDVCAGARAAAAPLTAP